jgi:pyruvate/2-oxoacid:ferredoxin oxidoreductase beta subunit
MAAHRIPYAATATVAHPDDLVAKVRRAKAIHGTRFLHVLAPCPPGWKTGDDEVIALGRMAVATRAFPLLEVENGKRWRFTVDHPGDPIGPYIRKQGRFRHLGDEQVREIQAQVDARWEWLRRRVELGG